MKFEVIRKTEDRITEEAVEGSATNYVAPGSVLMVMRSGILRHTFPVAVNADRVTVNQDLRALTPAAVLDPYFLAHYLRSTQRQILHDCSKDGTTVQSVDAAALERVWVPVAPEREQRQIVARIDDLFAEIYEGEAALERARSGLDTWRRVLLKAAVTGELTKEWREANSPTETGADLLLRLGNDPRKIAARSTGALVPAADDLAIFEELPANWTWARLNELSFASSYGTSVKCDYAATGHPVLRIPNVRKGRIDLSDLKRAAEKLDVGTDDFVLLGDLLIVRTNGSEDLIGRGTVVIDQMDTDVYFASYLIRFRLLGDHVLWRWIAFVFNSPLVRQWMTKHIASSAGQYNVSQSSLSKLCIPLPPYAEIEILTQRLTEQFASAEDTASDIDRETFWRGSPPPIYPEIRL